MHRRDFISTMAVTAALAPARAVFGRQNRRKVGLQLYTIRQLMAQDLERGLETVAQIGYEEVEFAGLFGRSPRSVRTMLDRYGLSAVSSHIEYEALGERWSETLEAAATLGQTFIVCPWIAEPLRTSIDGWRKVAENLTRAGSASKRIGIQFAYHNHDVEFFPVDGLTPYEVLLSETDPNFVKMELDLYWVRKANREAADFLTRYPGRFPLLHLKDMAPNGDISDVGTGVIDFAGIFEHLRLAGVEHCFVENDEPVDPVESIKTGFTNSVRLLSRVP